MADMTLFMPTNPGTRSMSTAFLAIWVAARWTKLVNPRLEQNRD